MGPDGLVIENLLPHRGRMKLIDAILAAESGAAVTHATVTRDWPLADDDRISPLVCIELVAQTSAVLYGIDEDPPSDESSPKHGWLVGIRRARFLTPGFRPGTGLIIRAENKFIYDQLREVSGRVELESGRLAAEVALQVVEAAGTDGEQDSRA